MTRQQELTKQMTTLYKLTDQKSQTRNATQWGENVTHKTNGEGDLCGPGWLHAYTDPILAVLLNPIHADISSPQIWECDGVVGKNDNGLKVGCTQLTTIKQMSAPIVTIEHRVRFGILCAMAVYDALAFQIWAKNWLSGEDRSEAAWADAAAWAARATEAWADAAAWAARATEAWAWAARATEAAVREAAAKAFDLISLARQAFDCPQ